MTALEVGLVFTLVGATIVLLLAVGFPPATGVERPVEPRLRRVMANRLDLDPWRLTLTTSLRDDLGLRAADVVTLGPALEEELAIIIPERLLRGVETFGDLVRAAVVLIGEREDEERVTLLALEEGEAPSL
jgi:acyl carrier protein